MDRVATPFITRDSGSAEEEDDEMSEDEKIRAAMGTSYDDGSVSQ